MILEKDQIHRYMRHIIMPEIGGAGQKKLLNSSVLICCEDLNHSSFMLFYLTAMGIGNIICRTGVASDSQPLFDSLKKLNPGVTLSIENSSSIKDAFDAIIILNQIEEATAASLSTKNIPVIISAEAGDRGFLRTIIKDNSFNSALTEYKDFHTNNRTDSHSTLFNYPCACLMGALSAIETIKAVLEVGSCFEEPLYVDLWSYSFSNNSFDIPPMTNSMDKSALTPKLKNAKALIIGSGGLGSPVAYILAQMGIGKLGLVDYDIVEISNLNRQILHSTDKIGMPKVESAKAFLMELNPDLEIHTYNEKFSVENAESLVNEYDIIIDGLDNLPTRYLLNDTCYFLKKPLIEAGVLSFYGLATAILPEVGPCYRCTFLEAADTGSIPSCSETGVLGAVPGIMGALQSVEVIKQLTGIGNTLLNKIIMFDALNAEFTMLDIYKEESCPLCGTNPTIDALKDYNFVCSSKNKA